ncbi:MAG: rseA [Rhodocyclales bacterium]|nr:rseA [Rhodocyclales bacterium]
MMDEQISAWIDGELADEEARRVREAVARQAAMQARCGTLWLIGDVMRDESPLSANFTERVMAVLETEPTILTPMSVPPRAASPAPRWLHWAAAAAGVAVVAWSALNGGGTHPVDVVPVVAATQSLAQQFALQTSMRQGDDDRPYLMAHQAYGPGVQMAGVSGYMRPVSLDQPIASR